MVKDDDDEEEEEKKFSFDKETLADLVHSRYRCDPHTAALSMSLSDLRYRYRRARGRTNTC